jgi:hypothetical protein
MVVLIAAVMLGKEFCCICMSVLIGVFPFRPLVAWLALQFI